MTWFHHDVHMSEDPDVATLILELGNDGYGLLLRVYERIYANGAKIDLSNPRVHTAFTKGVNSNDDDFDDFMALCLSLSLFDSVAWEEQRVITSDRCDREYSSFIGIHEGNAAGGRKSGEVRRQKAVENSKKRSGLQS